MGDSFVGIQARLMSQALRKLTGAVSRSNTALVFTNQLREKIGVMFGNPETTPGGRALKFYASVRLDIRRIETIKTGTDAIGSRARVKVVKNKVAAPFRVAEFDVMYGEGISREGGLLDVGVATDVVTKTGAWFTYGETRLGQGREAAKEFLKQNKDVAERIESEIRAQSLDDHPAGRGHRRGRVGFDRGRTSAGAGDDRPTVIRRAPGTGRRPACRAGRDRDPAVVLDAAAAFLEVRPRSVDEMRRRLRHLGYPAALIEVVIDRLLAYGYLDDEAFARAWVESRDRARPRGEAALRRELVLKGIDRELISAVLAGRDEEVAAPAPDDRERRGSPRSPRRAIHAPPTRSRRAA